MLIDSDSEMKDEELETLPAALHKTVEDGLPTGEILPSSFFEKYDAVQARLAPDPDDNIPEEVGDMWREMVAVRDWDPEESLNLLRAMQKRVEDTTGRRFVVGEINEIIELVRLHRLPEARRRVEEILSKDSLNNFTPKQRIDVLINAGSVYAKLGVDEPSLLTVAESFFALADRLEPDALDIKINLVLISLLLGRRSEARDRYVDAISLVKRKPEWQAELLSNLEQYAELRALEAETNLFGTQYPGKSLSPKRL
jgi:hypothetical protein